jgi:glycosyl hydrolase family 26
LVDTQRLGRHRQAPQEKRRRLVRRPRKILAAAIAIATLAIIVAFAVYNQLSAADDAHSAQQQNGHSTAPGSYIGLYVRGVPDSYAGVTAFTAATGIKPGVVSYYSGWLESFKTSFAVAAATGGAVPLVQINPTGISIAAIANGQYDNYLSTYAKAVRAYHRPVILSFGHEMNGYWYSWGYTHTSPAVFVAAWRHIVTLFRTEGASNVTWLWTINTVHTQTGVPSPSPWWPGSSYVNWVGIDGYYLNSSSVFASVFGPTIADVRTLTHDPILIAETAATPAAIQPEKIADLFAGIHLYGLLGFVWFDSVDKTDLRLRSPAAIAALRRAVATYQRSGS